MATRFLVIDGKIAKDTRTGMPVALTDNIFTSVTYEVLKTMRDNGHLLSGEQYRIVDFVTTTSQENTQSAGHPFDIIVVADSPNTLNENARAVAHEGDTYFANCKLSAWEIKYCLDNDKTRFWWAFDGQMIVNLESAFSNGTPLTRQPIFDGSLAAEASYSEYQYAWGTQADVEDDDAADFVYSKTETLTNGETVYNANYGELEAVEVVGSKGVIYYMKDEYGNECPYDFKNIQFKRDDTYYYTFSWVDENEAVKDLSIVGNTELYDDTEQVAGCYENKIGIVSSSDIGVYVDNPTNVATALNNNVFISTYSFEGGIYYGCHSNTFWNGCHSNTFGNGCKTNTFGNGCHSNTFGNDCKANTFRNDCQFNTFGNGCHSNTFGNGCKTNTFGYVCYCNTFGNECYGNTFGDFCYNNTFGDVCELNAFGNECQANIVDNKVRRAQPQPTTGEQPMQGVHIHYGVTGQFTVVRGAKYTQDVRTANDVTITV